MYFSARTTHWRLMSNVQFGEAFYLNCMTLWFPLSSDFPTQCPQLQMLHRLLWHLCSGKELMTQLRVQIWYPALCHLQLWVWPLKDLASCWAWTTVKETNWNYRFLLVRRTRRDGDSFPLGEQLGMKINHAVLLVLSLTFCNPLCLFHDAICGHYISTASHGPLWQRGEL